MATIRPNAEPPVSVVQVGDIFLIDGATGVRALTASSVAVLDANGNVANINNLINSFVSIATAGGTTVLTAASAKTQHFTGTLNQTVVLPVVSTLALNHTFIVENASTGIITVNSSGGNLVSAVAPGATVDFGCVSQTGTTAASWLLKFDSTIVASGKLLTVSNSLTLAGVDGKTLTVNNSLALAGTDATTMTFPSTSATLARTDAGQTFTGTQAFGALTATSVNGNTWTSGTGVLTIAAAKTLTASNSLTLAGTDGTTMTFPGASDTVVTLAAAQTLTNKTFDTAGAGNIFKINGTQITANTGTGSNVLATSPVLVTPALGAATGTSLILTGGSISFATSGQGVLGTTTNDNASGGVVGEYVESVIPFGSAVSLTSSASKTVTSIPLTAGDWDVAANGTALPASTTSTTAVFFSVSTTNNTIDSSNGREVSWVGPATVAGGNFWALAIQPLRFSLSTPTTIYLVANSTFTVSTSAAFGLIRARRVR